MPEMKRTGTVMMLMMSGSRRPDIRHISLLGPGAGPSRRRRGPGPLPTLSMPSRVMEPWRFVTSLRSVTSISATPFTTAWSMAFRSIGPGRHWAAVGPSSSYLRDAGWNCATSVTGPGRPAGRISLRSLRHRLGSCFALFAESCCRVTRPGSWRLSDPRWRSLRPCSWLCEQWWSGWISLAGLLHMESGKPVIGSLRRLGRGGCFPYSGCWLWPLRGRAKCWHQKTWMNPLLQLECSLLGYPGQLARHPLPAIPTAWSVAFWPIGAGPSHHRHAGSHWLLGLTGPGRPDGRLLHLRSLWPRTCGCHGSLELGRPWVDGTWKAGRQIAPPA